MVITYAISRGPRGPAPHALFITWARPNETMYSKFVFPRQGLGFAEVYLVVIPIVCVYCATCTCIPNYNVRGMRRKSSLNLLCNKGWLNGRFKEEKRVVFGVWAAQ